MFSQESGKHVVQRVPPTERNGRRQTSIIAVSVYPLKEYKDFKLDMNSIRIETKRGSGPGGQHRNKTESAVRITHINSSISVTIDSRDQHANKKLALSILEARLSALKENEAHESLASLKKQHFNGQNRGNKIRTYNFIENRAKDHRTGVKISKLDKIMNGHFELLNI